LSKVETINQSQLVDWLSQPLIIIFTAGLNKYKLNSSLVKIWRKWQTPYLKT
jgi:hypothetical protein